VLGAVGIALFALVIRPRDAEERIALILGTAAVLAALGAAVEVRRLGLATRDEAALGAGLVKGARRRGARRRDAARPGGRRDPRSCSLESQHV
jgi:hypothetical protein